MKRFLVMRQLIAPERCWVWRSEKRPGFYQPGGLVLYVTRKRTMYQDGTWENRVQYIVKQDGMVLNSSGLVGVDALTHRSILKGLLVRFHKFDHIIVETLSESSANTPAKSEIHVTHSHGDYWDLEVTTHRGNQIVCIRCFDTIQKVLNLAVQHGDLPVITITDSYRSIEINRTAEDVVMFILQDPKEVLEEHETFL